MCKSCHNFSIKIMKREDEKAKQQFILNREKYLTEIDIARIARIPKKETVSKWQENYLKELNLRHSKSYGNYNAIL